MNTLSLSRLHTHTNARAHPRLRCIPPWATSRRPLSTSRSPSPQPPTPHAPPPRRAPHPSAVRSPSLYTPLQSRRLSPPSSTRLLLFHLLRPPQLLLALLLVNKAMHISLPPPEKCKFPPAVPGRTRFELLSRAGQDSRQRQQRLHANAGPRGYTQWSYQGWVGACNSSFATTLSDLFTASLTY
jgi:hypothetical protein